ncbi:NPCBM/NEW2 domain-containing protein [Sphaerisporangium dianthi]|uniref:NPCBM/NEW2 domain-containing protein n=1 Tax=Sphaerisporangium dianthi TaxID=1436120 RepID=A0ABV9CCF2_9ACTN
MTSRSSETASNDEPQGAPQGQAPGDSTVKVAVITAVASIAVALIGLIGALGTGYLQYVGPGTSPTPATTVTETITIDTPALPAPSPGSSSATNGNITGGGKLLSQVRRVGQWEKFEWAQQSVNGKAWLDSLSAQQHQWCQGAIKQTYALDGKYSKFEALVAIGDDGSEMETQVEFSIDVDKAVRNFNVRFGQEPMHIAVPLTGNKGKALRLTLGVESKDCKSVRAVWISPKIYP